jgi:acetyl-CoA/propionyl-CoA carboxylase biotin carboxyl carrier protein
MNTRLQVEHGVTELVTGLDLVSWQIRIAAGEAMGDEVLAAAPRGHAIEARVYAEDPYDGFRPVAGAVSTWEMPAGPGVRVDAGVEAGTRLRPEYDPLLAKLLVHAADRPAAVSRLRRALDETLIGGVQTDLGFHRWLVDETGFGAGSYDTSLVADRWGRGPDLTPEEMDLAAAAARDARLAAAPAERSASLGASPVESAWATQARRDGIDR